MNSSLFQKYRLVPASDEQVKQERKIADYDPKLRSMAFLQSEIDDILNNKELGAEARLKIFNLAQNRFLAQMHQSFEPPVPSGTTKFAVPTAGEQSEGVEAKADDEDDVKLDVDFADAKDEPELASMNFDRIVHDYPKTYKDAANRYLKHVHDDESTLFVDDRNHVYINDKQIPRANFYDFMEYMFRPLKKLEEPPGFSTYWKHVLEHYELPNSYIPNKALQIGKGRKSHKHARKQKRSSFHFLHVY